MRSSDRRLRILGLAAAAAIWAIVFGLNKATPRHDPYMGVSMRF